MRSGFHPHDHDRTTESMVGSLLGFGPLVKGFGLQIERGVSGYAVNRWSIKRPPNDTKLDRRSTGGIPRPLGKPRAIPRSLTPTHEKKQEGCAGGGGSAGLQNGQRGKCSDAKDEHVCK